MRCLQKDMWQKKLSHSKHTVFQKKSIKKLF